MKVRRARFKGEVARHSEALALLKEPGDMVLVRRGEPRLLMFACPDGCGDVVPINLDPRADKAWRHYTRGSRHSLFPSVWRDEGCRAHFVLWDDVIYWTGHDQFGPETSQGESLRRAVAAQLDPLRFKSYADIAVELQEIPWAVLVACTELKQLGIAEEAPGFGRGEFRKVARAAKR